MNAITLLEYLRESSIAVFTIKDISRIIDKSEAYTSLTLFRLKKKNLILEIEKGKYCLKDTNILAIASNLVFPSYISFLSALSYYKATTQIPVVIEVFSPKVKKEIIFQNYKIKFYKTECKKIFGYSKMIIAGKTAFIVDAEKLILDCLFSKQIYLKEVLYLLKNFKIDKEKLFNYSVRLSSKIVFKRLAYLLKITKNKFDKMLPKWSNRYEPLNPFLPAKGIKNKEFKLILNEEMYA